MEFDERVDQSVTFESFGVRIRLESNSKAILSRSQEFVERALLGNLRFIENSDDDRSHRFGIVAGGNGTLHLYRNGERSIQSGVEADFFRYFESMVRITVAEYAQDRVFVHAGVVGWKGKVIVMPASSHSGKTTLVAELIKRGAVYYSDEYAILDSGGMVHPFPRPLTIRDREDSTLQSSVPVEQFDCEVGENPAPVGAVLLTTFRDGTEWKPEILGLGQGILETIPHAIPLHADTKLSLELLNVAFAHAIIAKSFRGDVDTDAKEIFAFLDKHLN